MSMKKSKWEKEAENKLKEYLELNENENREDKNIKNKEESKQPKID